MQEESPTSDNINRQRHDALDEGYFHWLIDIATNGEVVRSSGGDVVMDGQGEPMRRQPTAAMLKLIREERDALRTRLEDEAGLRGEVEDAIARMGDSLPPLDDESDDDATR